MRGFYNELRRRHVLRLIMGTAVLAWSLGQGVSQFGDLFGLAENIQRLIIPWLFVLIPIAAVAGWFLNAPGDDAPIVETQRDTGVRLIDLVLVVSVLVILGFLIADRVAPQQDERAARYDAADLAAVPSPSVAVLPFRLEGGVLPDFYERGVAEEIYHALTRAQGVAVRATESSFRYAPDEHPLLQIGVELQVRHVLTGTLASSGDEIRVRARLVSLESGEAAWSDIISTTESDLPETQRAIAAAALEALGVSSTALLAPEPQVDPDVYRRYLYARSRLNERSVSGVEEARTTLLGLLVNAPDDVGVLIGLAQATLLSADNQYGSFPVDDAAARATPLIERALALAPGNARAHATEGALRILEGRFTRAEDALGRAIELAPTYAQAYSWLALARSEQGRVWASRAALARAVELDPQALPLFQSFANEFAAARPEDVTAMHNRFALLHPGHPSLALADANRHEADGALDEAVLALLPIAEAEAGPRQLAEQRLAWLYWRLGMVNAMRAVYGSRASDAYLDAVIAQRDGRCEDAASIGRDALDGRPSDRDWLANTAIWSACAGDWAAVRVLLEPLDNRSERFDSPLFVDAPETPGLLAALLAISRRREGDIAAADELADRVRNFANAVAAFREEDRLASEAEVRLTAAYASAAEGDGAAVVRELTAAFDAGLREPPIGDPVFQAYRDTPGAADLAERFETAIAAMQAQTEVSEYD